MSRHFFLNDTATPEIYTLSLHDALPISHPQQRAGRAGGPGRVHLPDARTPPAGRRSDHGLSCRPGPRDRKSTRLNSSHGYISYAVFCLKKKKTKTNKSQQSELYDTHTSI